MCYFGPIGKTRWPPWPLIGWDIFDFSSETAEPNSTKFDRRQDLKALYQVCVFQVDRKNKMAALASDWLRHFRLLLWNRWMEFSETWQEASSQCLLPHLCFSGKSGKTKWPLIGWDIFDFSSETVKGIQWNLIGSKIATPSTKFVFFRWIGKTKWPPWPMIGWDIFDFSYETTERNSTKLDRKQVLNVLYQVCVFRADPKNNMAALASDWLRHILTFPLKPLNGIQRNLTGSKILTSLYQVCFFGAEKLNKNCHPGQSIKEGGTLYSGARNGALWASCLWIYFRWS